MSKSKNQAHNDMEKQERENDLLKRARDSGMNFRSVDMETVEEEGKQPVVRMSVSSEMPVLTYIRMGDQWMYAWEILDHSESSIDRSRCSDGLVIQDTHWGDQVGLIRAPMIVSKKLSGNVEFCSGERAENIGKDAAKGLRKNSSVGYMTDPQKYVIEGEKDGYPVVRSMRWTPYEASFVNVPADVSVGVGRSLQTENQKPEVTGKERIMEAKDIAQLFERAAKFGIDAATVSGLVAEGKGRAELDALIVDKQAKDAEGQRTVIQGLKDRKPDTPEARTAIPVLGGDAKTQEKIVRQYSVLNVCRRAKGITTDILGRKVDCGFEDDVSEECRKLGMGSSSGGGSFTIPHAVLASRTFNVTTTASASVQSDLRPDLFIDVLRTNSVIGAAGVQFITGLVGPIDIPKMTAGGTGYWVAEGNPITESDPTLGQVNGTPRTCGVMVDITRRMLLQSTPSAEQMIRNEIMERINRTIQVAVFQGGGTTQPIGIKSWAGINNPTVTPGTPTYLELLGFPGAILSDNAAADNQKWIMTGEVWQKLAGTFTDGTAKAEHVLDFNSKTCLGFPYLVTEDVGANSLFFGNWASVIVGIWGAGLDLNMDTSTLSSSGGLRLVGLQDVDVMVRNGEALAYNSAVTAD